MKIGFVGLGVMGGPMAGHLVASGRDVVVWNRSTEKTLPFAEHGTAVAGSLSRLAGQCDVVCLCVSRSEDVEACLDEMMGTAKPGTLFIDHSTISPTSAQKIAAKLQEAGFRFVDAPITGGSMGARSGQLTIFCGGEEADVETAIEVIRPYTKRAERVGPSGAGQMMKMANQIAVGGTLAGLCECLNFAAKAGLDLAQAKDLIGSGAGGSWSFENYGPKILNHDWSPGFSIKNQRKDFAYCEEAAKAIGAAIPTTLVLDQLLGELEAQGKGGLTTAALFELLNSKEG